MGISTQIGLVLVVPHRAKWLVGPIGGERIGSESEGTMFRTDATLDALPREGRTRELEILAISALPAG
jgi:hypothetical protein